MDALFRPLVLPQLFAPQGQALVIAHCTCILLQLSSFSLLLQTATLSGPAMSTIIPHTQCGLYMVFSATDNHYQVIVNGLIGQEQVVKRTDDMIQSGAFYKLGFSPMGMGHLTGGCQKIWVSSLGWSRVAVIDENGKVALRDPATDERTLVDDPHLLRQRKSRTLNLSSDLDLVFTTFIFERSILQSRLGPMPHQIGGNTYWEFRCLKKTLIIDYEKDNPDLEATWEKRNFHNCYDKWAKLYDSGGGVHPKSHWFSSQKSWKTDRVKADIQSVVVLFVSTMHTAASSCSVGEVVVVIMCVTLLA